MSGEIVTVDTSLVYTPEKIELIKNTICMGATDNELELFLHVCKRTGLDPFARQIYSIGRWDNRQKRNVMQTQVSIDGARLVAQRSGKYQGQTLNMWCGPDGKWTEVWLKKEFPAAAKVGVYHSDFKEPLFAVATWESYVQRGKSGVTPMWQKMGALMLSKCAEMLALRKAFPAELSGLYTAEEMSQADTPRQSQNKAPEPRNVQGQAKEISGLDKAMQGYPRDPKDMVFGPNYLYVVGRFKGRRNKEIDLEKLREYFGECTVSIEKSGGEFRDKLSNEMYLALSHWLQANK